MEGEYNLKHNRLTKKWIIVPLVFGIFTISISIISLFVTCYAEQKTESILTSNTNSILDHVHDRAGILFRVNASTFALASSFESTKINSFAELDKKVAPRLFLALVTTQLASQVSYIGNDGLIFSYERENRRINAVFSNSSDPCSFYNQKIDQENGARYGDAFPLKCNETKQRFLDALTAETGYYSVNGEIMLFFTFEVRKFGAVSIGVALKDLLKYVSEISSVQGRLFFAMNGSEKNPSLVSLDASVFDDNGLKDASVSDDNGLSYELLSGMYKLMSTRIDMSGISLVFTVGFPYKYTMTTFRALKVVLFSLVPLAIILLVTVIIIMAKLIKKSQIQEVILRADLIRQKEAVQQAERKSMNKSMAFARASHDVRNQMYSITMTIDHCLAEVDSETELARNLDQMKSCAANLLEILNSILDTSKVESGKMELKVDEFEVSKLIEESVDSFNVIAHNKGVEMIWDPCDFSVLKLGKVRGDSLRFKQVLNNLLGNAVKFTDEGRIVVRAWAKKPNLKLSSISSDYGCSLSRMFCCLSRRLMRYWRKDQVDQQGVNSVQIDPFSVELTFEVDDTGLGIPVEKRASVFENYVQVKEDSLFKNEAKEGRPQGTGLGLGIVQSFVRLMGGEISIQDKEPGSKGTCFKFNILLSSSEFHDTNTKDEKSESTSQFPGVNDNVMVKGVHSLLFVRGYETKKVLTRWMESHGVRVCATQQINQISPTLERIKHNANSTSKSDSILFCKTFSRNSSSLEREGFLSAGRENATDSVQRKAFYGGMPVRILMVVDISSGDLSKILSSLRDFMENNPYIMCKVVCITDFTSNQDLQKFKNLPCKVIDLKKPVHGSRLITLLDIIQELERMDEGDVMKEMNQPLDENKKGKQSVKQNEIGPEVRINIEDTKPLSGMKILYAEDMLMLRVVGSKIMANLGATVVLAENGFVALQLVKQTLETRIAGGEGDTYDVILMDCQMPLMTGYEATREIREEENRYGIHVPIIALTANTSEEEAKATLRAGMDFHLEKPLEPKKLLEAISLVLGNKT